MTARGAMILWQRVEAVLKKRFDDKIKPFGVRIGGIGKCAIGTRPPVAVPVP